MPSDALILSRDSAVICQLRELLSGMGLIVEVATGSQQATAELARRRFEAVLIDCDDVHGARDALTAACNGNGSAKVLAIVNGITSEEEARRLGASVAIRKPLSAASLAESLRGVLQKA